MARRILVVDDEKGIVKGLRFSLEQDDMEVDCAYDGEEALSMAEGGGYDLILLDVMLPKMDGLEVCRAIREFSAVPIIMLTAKGEDMDKILGLDCGADDYITKPFNVLEVKARIKAILRRAAAPAPARQEAVDGRLLTQGDVTVDPELRSLTIQGKVYHLTAREYELFLLLFNHPGKVYSREQLLEAVWGSGYPGDARTVDVHVRRLREKIEENPREPRYVHTRWGVGYYFHA